MLQELFQDDNKRLEVRRIIYDAIKKYFVIDPTELGKFSIRLSDTEPKNTLEEIGVHKDAIAFHEKAMDINIASDGVKAFTGIVTTVIAGDPKIILLDEPEAFLHPSLSFTLGKEISKSIDGKTKNLFVATHSSNFLMGCIQSGVPLNIIRLTYTNNAPTARILSNDKVLKLMRHPLLRSTGVLNGLFYEFVIVTEADSDRAFYQEINERLLAFDPSRGIPNCLFLNAQNKQTIHEIIRPLREMGIPSIAIVDVDVIKEGGRNWSNLLESANIPDALIQSLNQLRKIILNYLKESDLDFKRNGGIEILNGQEETACRHLFNQLDEFGIFTVRKGELESWLKHIKIPNSKHGNTWLIEMFEKLGEDPNSASYIKPGEGDVWQFMSELKEWFLNPKRNGIPD